MTAENPKQTIIQRAENFRWNVENIKKYMGEELTLFTSFENLTEKIVRSSCSDTDKNTDESKLLGEIFYKVYLWIGTSFDFPEVFFSQAPSSNCIYEACFFTTLCTFLHASKRIEGISLKEFVRQYHPLDFKSKKSPNFRTSLLDDESDKLRQFRHRLLSQRKVYIKDVHWAGMPKSSVHEWNFFYQLEHNINLKTEYDTFKRIKHLSSDIYKALTTKQDRGYISA